MLQAWLDDTTLLEQLRAAGVVPHMYEPVLYLSIPEQAEVELEGERFEARPAPFCRSTDNDAVIGLCRLADPDAGTELTGTVALVDAKLSPDLVFTFEHRGAAAQIYLESDGAPPRSCSTIWGAPTHENVARRPRTPIVIAPARDAERMRRAAAAGARARISTRLREGWVPARLPVVEIHGAHHPEEFLLLHGSDDHALVALARDLHARRGDLIRSVRIAWWPDRALESGAGSTWYADVFAAEIDQWCVAHVSAGSSSDGDPFWMPEAAELCLSSIAGAGQAPLKGRRPPRAADYSFNQIGVTGLFGGRAFPTAVYADAITRIITAPIYPFDYTAPVLEMGAAVQRYQAAAGNDLDLSGVSHDLARLRRAIAAWRSDADTELRRHPADQGLRQRLNATLRGLARVIVPLGFSRGERFDQDPALRFSCLPRLEAALHIAESAEPMRSFVRTALVRETNKIRAALREAVALVT